MFGLFSSIAAIVRLGPREFIRQKFKLPLVKFIHDTVNLYKSRTKAGVNNIREILFRGTVIALITALLVWLSIFMYIAFYYVYVPTISHERPVYLKFKPCGAIDSCEVTKGICSFPSAHVQLTKRQQLLMMGQPYKIHLDLDMPESPTNRELGMFMVCVDFRGKKGQLLANSCRSTMLHYRGFLLDTLYKLVFSPFFVFGTTEEKQKVHVELFSDYEEQEHEPVTDIFVEIQSRFIEIYSAKFSVNAQFSGLRYIMFHWPVLSAALGITANLFFIALVCMISWYQIINSEEYLNFIEANNTKTVDNDNGAMERLTWDPLKIATITLMPIFISYDIYKYSTAQCLYLMNIPTRVLNYRPKIYPVEIFKNMWIYKKDNEEVLKNEDIKRDKDRQIVCATHKKSGCQECLANNSDSSYSVDYDDTSLLVDKDLRRRGTRREDDSRDYVEALQPHE